MNRTARRVLMLVFAVSAAATAIAAVWATRSATPDLGLWLGLLLAGAVMEYVTIAGDDDEEHPFSLATTFHIAAILLLPPGWAALVAGGATGIGEAARRRSPIRVAFNSGVALTATLAGGAAYNAALPEGGRFGWQMYPALLALLLAYIPVMVIAVESITTAVSGQRPDLMSWIRPAELLAYLTEACIAVVLAVLVDKTPKMLAVSVLLFAAVFLSIKRYRALKSETRQTLRALAAAVDARDPYTAAHSERVGEMAADLASALGLPNRIVLDVRWAGRLHDLGKIVVDNSILHKEGALDQREWELMRSHPNVSAELLEPLSLTRRLGPGVRYHHERQDGGGYFGVRGDDIPIEAALITIADSYDAMTTDRPYRKAMTREQALGRIEDLSGTQFHPEFARAFVAMMRGEPVEEASMVRTSKARRRLWLRRARGDDPVDSARAWPEMPDLDEQADWPAAKSDVSETHVS